MPGQTIRMELAYDGTGFAGFARQPGHRTVESVLRERLGTVVEDVTAFAVGGRTDRGVHATAQVVSFRSRQKIDLQALGRAVAQRDDPELWVADLRRVSGRFHAQFSARQRHYVYLWPDVEDLAHLSAVNRLAMAVVGRHDFRAFCRRTPPDRSTTKRLTGFSARLGHLDDQPRLRFDVSGEGFLRREVRVLVATVLREARRGAPDDRLLELVHGRERTETEPPAPPQHLILSKVVY